SRTVLPRGPVHPWLRSPSPPGRLSPARRRNRPPQSNPAKPPPQQICRAPNMRHVNRKSVLTTKKRSRRVDTFKAQQPLKRQRFRLKFHLLLQDIHIQLTQL